MFRSTGLVALLSLGCLTKRVVAAPAHPSRSSSSISWGSCLSFGVNSTDPNLQCGFLEVPLDYHDSSAGNAQLAVAKYVATASKKLGTIFFNPGGPGGSGVEVAADFGPTFSQASQGLFDFVSWDPRGVGNTTPGPVYCFDNAAENAVFFENTPVAYINESIAGKFDKQDYDELYSQADATQQKLKTWSTGCLNGPSGKYLKYIGTSSTVRDLVSLGDAIVGQGQPIDYWGISYGTVIGFNFVNMFPERAGRVILDGVVYHDIWVSYKTQQTSLTNSEKTYSGLTDGCAKAGRAGCKLIEITGDNATGDDVKALIDNSHDLALEIYRKGYNVPVAPGLAKDLLFNLMYTPETWSSEVNTHIYAFVALVLQASQALNITVPGCEKYNVPTGNITLDTGASSPPALVVYSTEAIVGADYFVDDGATIKDVFDAIVDITRDVTPTFGADWSPVYSAYDWPVRSVEQLPPYTPVKLKVPVLVIGNMADPITPFASAQKTADLFGDDAFLVEQLGFGHTSLAQSSSCTFGIMADYFVNSTLPEGRSVQCPVDNSDLFPPLNGTTTAAKRSNKFLRRRL